MLRKETADMAERVTHNWIVRAVAIASVTVITLFAMHLKIDGIFVPLIGIAIASGIAGYQFGQETMLMRLAGFSTDSEGSQDKEGRREN